MSLLKAIRRASAGALQQGCSMALQHASVTALERPKADGTVVSVRGRACSAVAVYEPAAAGIAPRWERVGRQRAEFVAACGVLMKERRISWKEAFAFMASRLAEFPELPQDGVAEPTARRWKYDLRGAKGDWKALVPGYRNCGRPLTASMDHPFLKLVAQAYLVEGGPELPYCYQNALTKARQLGMDHPELRLSLEQCAYFFDKPGIREGVEVKRLGEEEFRNRRMGYLDLDWNDIPVGYCLVGDHHVFDCMVKKWDAEKGKFIGVRPWFSGWMDCRSLFFVGGFIRDIEPNSVAVEDSYLNAVRKMGNIPPAMLKTDNGHDYLSYGFATDIVVRDEDGKEHPHSVLRAMGTRHCTALPYNARAKTIERMFGIVARTFARSWASRRGNSPDNRPSTTAFAEKHPELLPSLQEFTEAFSWWLDNYYHKLRRKGKILGGRSPEEVWAGWKPVRSPLTDEELARAFMRPAFRTSREPMYQVGRGGRVTVDRVTYQSDVLWDYVGKKMLVKVCRTPGLERIVCCRPNGAEICEAKPVDLYRALGENRERLSEGQRQVRRQLVHARDIAQRLTDGECLQVGPVTDRMAIAGGSEAQAARMIQEAERAERNQDQETDPVSPHDDADMQRFHANMLAMNDERRRDEEL